MIFSYLMILAASALWALMSHYTFNNNVRDPYSFWGHHSWKRRYRRIWPKDPTLSFVKYDLIIAPDTWYYRLFKIKYEEKFPLSTTALVFVTDGYHLCQWIAIKCILLAITTDPLQFVILWVCWTIAFNVVYTLKKS